MASRFAVSDVAAEEELERESAPSQDSKLPELDIKVKKKGKGGEEDGPDVGPQMKYLNLSNEDKNQYTVTSLTSGNLALYEEELQHRPKISTLLSTLVSYDPIQPNAMTKRSKKKKKKANLGTIMGVYLPTLQNILGVILFLRLPWLVGMAGVGQSFLLVMLCCTTTFLTAISLSAIATNGHVPAGGSYFMISRNLGPEFGGAVGILFYLATTFAASLYVVGAIEILLTYIVPQIALFGDVAGDPNTLFNNIRVYGTILLLLMVVIVFVGVKIVNWFASLCLVAVLIAVASIYAGAFNPIARENLCTVNGVLLQAPGPQPYICSDGRISTAGNFTLNQQMGLENNWTESYSLMDVCFFGNPALQDYFNQSFYFPKDEVLDNESWTMEPVCEIGIPGLTRTQTINENRDQSYLKVGEVTPGVKSVGNQVQAEITTSFFVLIGIFFPSVTGIMAGSNRSGDLKDAQKSIPIGTLAAILSTSFIYLTCVLIFGGTIDRLLLRDQYGYASGLTVSLLAWPSRWVILIGALMSTIGAGLQSLTGAPRLMQAIANDNLIGFLRFFKRMGLNGEPSYALILTAILAEMGVLIASLDLVAPILTMFFLMCYMFVNFACTLQSFLKAPNWRPRFRYYHWSTSLLGALLCLTIMFLVSWYYALAALVVAVIIYKYIEYRGAEKEWGDGVRGLSLQAARYSLLKLEEAPLHTKNWRPQVLILCKLDTNLLPDHPKLLSLASQLKAGKGLVMVYSVLEGQFTDRVAETIAARQSLKQRMEDNKIKGFSRVIASPSIRHGLADIIQTAGLGGMKHNTIVLGWPDSWRKKTSWSNFVEAIRVASAMELAILVPKGINWFPSNEDRMKGQIDIWWVVHDGGLLMLLPFLLRQHKVWKHCHLRIFTVAQIEDNSIQMKKDLATFLYQLRIPAEVDVIEMPDTDISAYTYERTLIMEQRNEMLTKMRMTARQRRGDVQHLLARSFSTKQQTQDHLHPPTSPAGEISIPVPQWPRVDRHSSSSSSSHRPPPSSHTPLPPNVFVEDADDVSIGNLSTEPRVAGGNALFGDEAIELVPITEELGIDTSAAPPPMDGRGVLRRRQHSSSSESSSSSEEELSVRKPLLEPQQAPPPPLGSPPLQPPSFIRGYDSFFSSKQNGSSSEHPDTRDETTSHNLTTEPQEDNLRRMNTSVKLNELIVQKSHDASLVIVNLPGPPRNTADEENYMEFLDVLTEGLERVLMVRGGGREVITIYS